MMRKFKKPLAFIIMMAMVFNIFSFIYDNSGESGMLFAMTDDGDASANDEADLGNNPKPNGLTDNNEEPDTGDEYDELNDDDDEFDDDLEDEPDEEDDEENIDDDASGQIIIQYFWYYENFFGFDAGTVTLGDILGVLPDTLEASCFDDEFYVIDVKWEYSGFDFELDFDPDPDELTEYIFTAILPEEFKLADGITLPKIVVCVGSDDLVCICDVMCIIYICEWDGEIDLINYDCPVCAEDYTLCAVEPMGIEALAGAFTISGDSGWTYPGNVLTITGSGNYHIAMTVSGTTTTTDYIVVQSGVTANITLDGVKIDVSSISDAPAFLNSATINLTLEGENLLKSGSDRAGLEASSGAVLTIAGAGSLTAMGGTNGAGIGGMRNANGGTITINGGTVTATAGEGGAGIGGGNGYPIGGSIAGGASGTISINGGTVTAMGGADIFGYTNAAGIGGGYYGVGGSISISGGTVTATAGGSSNSSGIGGGNAGSSGTIVISGGTITATSAEYGRSAIGPASGGANTVTISQGLGINSYLWNTNPYPETTDYSGSFQTGQSVFPGTAITAMPCGRTLNNSGIRAAYIYLEASPLAPPPPAYYVHATKSLPGTGNGSFAQPYTTIQAAYNAISTGETAEIRVLGDLELAASTTVSIVSGDRTAGLHFHGSKTATISSFENSGTGDTPKIIDPWAVTATMPDFSGASTSWTGVVAISDCANITLKNIKIDANERSRAILVDGNSNLGVPTGSTLNIEDGTTITGGYTSGGGSPAGAGVFAVRGSTVNMSGGSITGNSSTVASASGITADNSDFNMSGGVVANNGRGGIFMWNANATITGGAITGNTGRGLDIGGTSTLTIGNGSAINIAGNTNGNVYLQEGRTITLDGQPAADSQIGITTQIPPDAGSPIDFATGANTAYPGGDSGWQTVFFSTNRTIARDGDKLQLVVNTYGISLSETGTYTFTAANYGYGTQTPGSVTIHNTGNQPTGVLTVALSGDNPGSFTLSTTSVGSIAVDDTAVNAFTVVPNTGLAAGTYTATVTVSGGNGITANFNVSFTVNPAIPLAPPDDVALDKDGTVTFTAGANNAAAGATYTFTLYHGATPVTGFIDTTVTDGSTPAGIVAKMLEATGAYTIRVTAHTIDPAYTTPSAQSDASAAVNVYSVTVTLSGISGDNVNGNVTSYTVNAFSGNTVTLTATPSSLQRKVTWSGDGEGTANVRTITAIAANAAVTATFAPKIAQTITASTYDKIAPVIGELITSTDGTYTANDGGAAGTHAYQWKRSDNDDRTGNVTNIATTKNYTPTGAEFGKYIWLETTPVGDGALAGMAVQGSVLRVGVRLAVDVDGAGGGTATVNGIPDTIVYGMASVAVVKNLSTDNIMWTASPNEGAFGDTHAENTTYTPAAAPSYGTIILTATLSAEIPLDPPTNVVLNKNGTVTFTAGTNNATAGGMSYRFTLYRNGDSNPVSGFEDIPVTSGTIPSGIAAKMLEAAGVYTIRVTAHTTNPTYATPSAQSLASEAINVFSVTVTISGASGTDNISGNAVTYAVRAFGGDDVVLTAVPDVNRKVTWGGSGSGTANIRTITALSANTAVAATFSALVAVPGGGGVSPPGGDTGGGGAPPESGGGNPPGGGTGVSTGNPPNTGTADPPRNGEANLSDGEDELSGEGTTAPPRGITTNPPRGNATETPGSSETGNGMINSPGGTAGTSGGALLEASDYEGFSDETGTDSPWSRVSRISSFDMDIYQRPIPGITIGDRTYLLFAPFGTPAWSLINLILGCIVGVLLAVIVASYSIHRKRRERKMAVDIFDVYEAKQKNLVWLAAVIGLGIAGAFLFALMHDMSRLMVILDLWTVTHAILITAQIVAIRVIVKYNKKNKIDIGKEALV